MFVTVRNGTGGTGKLDLINTRGDNSVARIKSRYYLHSVAVILTGLYLFLHVAFIIDLYINIIKPLFLSQSADRNGYYVPFV